MSGFVQDPISLYGGVDVEFNSLSEERQDLAPDDETYNVSEIHSFVSSDDMSSQNLIEEVLSFFGPTSSKRKQMRFREGTG